MMNRIHNLYIVFVAALISALIYSLFVIFSYYSKVNNSLIYDFVIQFTTSYLFYMIFYIPIYFIRMIKKENNLFKVLSLRKSVFFLYLILVLFLFYKIQTTQKFILNTSIFSILGYLSVDITIKSRLKIKETNLLDDKVD